MKVTSPGEQDTTRATIDGLKAYVREDEGKVAVDVRDKQHDEDPDLLIQSGAGGYQLDVWWGKSNQSNNWVKFGNQSLNYPHDNTHEREETVRAEKRNGIPSIIITDPDPRADQMGYGEAEIIVQRHEDGFRVELQWEDEMEESHRYAVVAPLLDPRVNPLDEGEDMSEREAYYEYVEPLVDTTRDE